MGRTGGYERRARVRRLRALLRARRYVAEPEATARALLAALAGSDASGSRLREAGCRASGTSVQPPERDRPDALTGLPCKPALPGWGPPPTRCPPCLRC